MTHPSTHLPIHLPTLQAPRLVTYAHWAEPRFYLLLLTNTALGGALSFLLFLCTQLNSAVTTLVVGNLKVRVRGGEGQGRVGVSSFG